MKKTILCIMALMIFLSTATGAWAIEGSADHAERLFKGNRIVRTYGNNRYDTSIAAANDLKKSLNIDKFDNVIVASGENYPDALSGSYLAKVKDAPVLLVNGASEGKIRSYINSNLKNGGKVYLLGGPSVVSSRFERSINGKYTVKRLYGSNRYDTNLAILKEAGVNGQDILICSGNGYADSLPASATGRPILLVNRGLTAKQKSYLNSINVGNIYLIGGPSVVNNTVAGQMKSYGTVKRLSGPTRYETSVAVAKQFWGTDLDSVVLTCGWNFPDGLSGGPLAMAIDSPIVLVGSHNSQINVSVNYTNKQGKATKAVVLGGPSLITNHTANRHITAEPAKKHTHEYVVPVYILNNGFDCYWCKMPSHMGSIDGTDFICGNYGSSQFATIAAYRCISCESMIDVKDYAHTCDWQPVYGIADIDRCNYCGEEGFTSFAEDDARFGSATENVTFRKVHQDNGCTAKCKAEHPDWDSSSGKLFEYLFEKNCRKEYISYYQCSKCSRIKNDTAPLMSLTVEGEKMDIPLIRETTDWTGLHGTEWIFETLEDLDLTGSEVRTLSPYLPIFGIYLFNTYPDNMSGCTEVDTYPCPLCGVTLDITPEIGQMSWELHHCK